MTVFLWYYSRFRIVQKYMEPTLFVQLCMRINISSSEEWQEKLTRPKAFKKPNPKTIL